MLLTGALALVCGVLETVLLYLISRIAVVLASDPESLTIGGLGPLPERTVSVEAAVGLALAALLVLVALSVPMTRSLASLSSRSLVRTRSRLIRAHMGASWRYRANQREGHFAQMVGEYSQRTEQLVLQLGVVLVAACQVSMLFAGALIVAPVATVAAAGGLALLAAVLRPMTRGVKSGSMKNADRNRSVVSEAQQLDRLSAEVVTFEVNGSVADNLEQQVRRAAKHLRTVRFRARLTPVLYQYGALGIVLLLIGGLSILDSRQVSGLAPLILLLIRALTYVRQLLNATQTAAELGPYWEAIEAEIAGLEAHPIPVGSVPVDRFERLVFDRLGFEYLAGHAVLDDVTLRVERGEALGLVGPSGGGKTTTIQLMLRLCEPTTGSILFNDVPLSDVRRDDWSRLVAFVPQENKLVSGTVADNIAFFRSGFTREQVTAAARRAHVHDEILALPDGYDTLVGPGSRALSGGQCQRIGIARAVLGAPELLILDEPTSALDARSEMLIRQSLEELRATTTLVLVAHRPATLEICTRVVHVERGSFAELALSGPAPDAAHG
jgi:ABC-type multidrug transport system fused ATPase/permease subunit